MSTKTQTTTTNAYNQGSMGAYNAFQPQLMSQYFSMLNNPLGTSFFQNQLAQTRNQANQLAGNAVKNQLQNLRAGGGVLSNSGGLTAAMLNRSAIGNNLMQANAFNSSLNNALASRNAALSGMAAYQPLQTGQTSTQTKSGLGTWLPQVAGAALGMAMPGIGSMLGGGSFMGGYGGGGGGMTPGPTMSAPQLAFGGPSNSGYNLGNSFSAAMQGQPYQF